LLEVPVSGSRAFRGGLIVLAVLSVLDLLGPLFTDGKHPPMAVALVGSVLGLASLALVVSAWRNGLRALLPLMALRVLSALTAAPAFFVSDAPVAAVVAASAIIVLTIVGIVLVLPATRRPTVAGAR